MEIQGIFTSARSVAIEIQNEGMYETKEYEIYLNNEFVGISNKVIYSFYDLEQDESYSVYFKRGEVCSNTLTMKTSEEVVSLNVTDYGAIGDGSNDDTIYIQTAILSCPKGGRVYIPKGIYKITSLFLKSDIVLHLEKDATLSAFTERRRFPVLPGSIPSNTAEKEYNLGTWEGEPLDAFASIITGIHVKNVLICGEGTIDGCADFDNWWNNPKVKNIAYRPRMLFLNRCEDIIVMGVTFTNSPSWNIHPYFSKNLRFVDIKVLSPANSCNTDGLDPESCENVEIAGCFFSVGDDCIAIKSGKIDMGKKYKVPSKNIRIRQSFMKDGHGAITIGSEIGAGVKDIVVENCKFLNTDRGLRIKTRRGRGEDSVIDDVHFKDIYMNQVRVPFVVNSFYFCDIDGKSDYVQNKEKLPVDDRTPYVKTLQFTNIVCENCHYAGAYVYGLPERKIEHLSMNHVTISFEKDAKTGTAAMMLGCEPTCKQGIYLHNIERVTFHNVEVKDCHGEPIILDEVDEFHID